MNRELAQAVTQLAINSTSCVNAATQVAGVEALNGPQDSVDAMVAAFRQRRDTIVNGLNALPGVRCRTPRGAFYAFPNLTETGVSEGELARRFLDEFGVACLPGTAFGEYGRGYLRFSYATSVANIERALERMAEALAAPVEV
jgi:aspartate/methionine/tyrosine aminotransferase